MTTSSFSRSAVGGPISEGPFLWLEDLSTSFNIVFNFPEIFVSLLIIPAVFKVRLEWWNQCCYYWGAERKFSILNVFITLVTQQIIYHGGFVEPTMTFLSNRLHSEFFQQSVSWYFRLESRFRHGEGEIFVSDVKGVCLEGQSMTYSNISSSLSIYIWGCYQFTGIELKSGRVTNYKI